MKIHRIPTLIFISALLWNCQSREDDLQEIDQTLRFYVENASGKDLLIPGDSLGYVNSIQLLDLNADRLNVPISDFTYKLDSTNMKNYLEYVGGATRILADSIDARQKSYFSDFLMVMKKNMLSAVADSDTIHIVYSWSPTLFQVSTVSRNDQVIFTKNTDKYNKITIVK